MNAAASLLLADARFPAGGHAHSGGVEPATTVGLVADLPSLELFLLGRLRTAGLTAAALTAAACAHAVACACACAASISGHQATAGAQATIGPQATVSAQATPSAQATVSTQGNGGTHDPAKIVTWAALDAEADARTPSPAQREASRRQGRSLLRAARAAWPGTPWLNDLGRQPHHPVILGATAAAAGCSPLDAARIAAYQAVTGPASAAVRLLALDPLQAAAILARLSGEVDDVAAVAGAFADGPLEDLPCPSAPALDLLAQGHARAEARLFES
jgi:urease accessory protein